MCDVRQWMREMQPKIQRWRNKRRKGVPIKRRLRLYDFAEHFLRKGEPFPASVIECDGEGLVCETCKGETPASYIRKLGCPFGRGEAWGIHVMVLCELCFCEWYLKAKGRRPFIPVVFTEIYESIPHAIREKARERRNAKFRKLVKQRYARSPESREKYNHDQRETYKRRKAASRGEVYQRQPYVAARPAQTSSELSPLAEAFRSYFANESKGKAA